MKKILLTGFEPFGGQTVNPSWQMVQGVREPARMAVVRALLPVTFRGSMAVLSRLMAQEKPDAVLCTGQAGGRDKMTVELLGVNLMDASIPDNEGVQPHDEKIAPDGPDALFATVPVEAMVQAMRQAGVPAGRSLSAGLYVCNRVLYGALLQAGREGPRCGFVHVPFLPEQAAGSDRSSMPLRAMIDALEAALTVL